MRSWILDKEINDKREENMTDPPEFIGQDFLEKLGVLYWKLNADDYENEGLLTKIRNERGYTYQDVIAVSKETLPDYYKKINMFFEEHIHSDEEIRFVLDGIGYFDVRNSDERWIRIEVEKGDLIVLPAGIAHRFTVNSKDYLKAMRLFVGEPVWTPINFPEAKEHEARKLYIKNFY